MGLIIKSTSPRVPPFSSIFAMIGWKNSWHFRHTWVKWFDPHFSNLFYPIKNNIKQFPSLEYHRFFGVSMSWTLLLKLNKTKPNGAFFGPHFCQMIFTFKMASFWVATRKPMDLVLRVPAQGYHHFPYDRNNHVNHLEVEQKRSSLGPFEELEGLVS